MKFGIWLDFRNPRPWRRPWTEVYEESIDLAVSAESWGFDSVWLSEHHLVDDGYLPSPFPVLAAVGARTRHIRLGTAMLLAPLYHPLRLAEDAAVTDLLTGGRLDLGLAPGYRHEEFANLGVPREQRGARTEETIEVLRRARTGEPFSYEGKHFTFDNQITVAPGPQQEGGVPLWIGGGGEAAAKRAGRHGCHFMPDLGTPPEILELYRTTLAEHGHDPARAQITAIVSPGVFVCDDADEGWALLRDHYLYLMNAFMAWFGNPKIPSADDLPRDLFLVGPPDAIVEGLHQRLKSLGEVDRVIFFARAPGLPIDQARASLTRFAEEVMPQLA